LRRPLGSLIAAKPVATVEAFGGRFIARGGKQTVLEGQWQNPRTVIVEFPTREAAEACINLPITKK